MDFVLLVNKVVVLLSLTVLVSLVKYLLWFHLQSCSDILGKYLEGLGTPSSNLLKRHTAVF